MKVKFYLEPQWVGGTKVSSRNPGHMTKMATMPIYGKKNTQKDPTMSGQYVKINDIFSPFSPKKKDILAIFSKVFWPFGLYDPDHLYKLLLPLQRMPQMNYWL